MATTYESVEDLAQALRRAEEAHGKHEQRTGQADPDWPTGTRSTWCVSVPGRSYRSEQRL